MSAKREDARCLGDWTWDGDFDCSHPHSGEVGCDDCKFGPRPKDGFDPRFPVTHVRNHAFMKARNAPEAQSE